MAFKTKIDYSSNRQVRQTEKTSTIFSGSTTFGIPFSGLTTGPDLTTIVEIEDNSGLSGTTFSGNLTTTIFTFADSRMDLAVDSLSVITNSNSGETQETGYVFTGVTNTRIEIDGNKIYTTYTGVTYSVDVETINDSGGIFTGTASHGEYLVVSAGTINYLDRTIWIDNPEITRTDRLIVTRNATPGYVLTSDAEGMASWAMNSSGGTGTNTDDYLIGGALNTGTGDLDLDMFSGGTVTINMDGRYAPLSAVTGGDTYWLSGSTGGNSIKTTSTNGSSTDATGNYAIATGYNTIASGNTSFTIGSGTTAGGDNSFASGAFTTASAKQSTAMGSNTTASAPGSHAQNNGTLASGINSHAEGDSTIASGATSHAEGSGTLAGGTGSHAEGGGTIASATYSHAEGNNTKASGMSSHAEGAGCIASTQNSHAEGQDTEATGADSHAQNLRTLASGGHSHAAGANTIASGFASFSSGQSFNADNNIIADGSTSFIHFEQTFSAATSVGAYADNSVILGGIDHDTVAGAINSGIFCGDGHSVSAGGINSVIIGGSGITATSPNIVYVPDLIIDGLTSVTDLQTDANGKIIDGVSDISLKKDINIISSALDKVKQLRGVSFNWTEESNMGEGLHYGMIAQEVKEVIPDMVRFRAKSDTILALDYKALVPWLVESVKELATPGSPIFSKTEINTETITSEDSYIELNFNGTKGSSIGGGIIVKNGIDTNYDSKFIIDINGDWTTNNYVIPRGLIIPEFTPLSKDDTGVVGEITRNTDNLFIKTVVGWKKIKLEDIN